MHHYGIDDNIRERVTIYTLVISLVLGYFINPWSVAFLQCISEKFDEITNFLEFFQIIGFVSPIITSSTIFYILKYLYENCLWKNTKFVKLHNITDFSGIWEGGLISDFKNPENGEDMQITMKLKIVQTWTQISCAANFSQSMSESNLAWITKNSKLKFVYTNNSEDVTLGLPQYDGYNVLYLEDTNTLKGHYFTTRIPSTKGTFLLYRIEAESIINETVGGNSED